MALTQVDGGLLSPTNAQYTGFKNKIINGGMVIDQRNNGASTTPATGTYTLDRWASYSSQSSKYSVQQNAGSVAPPVGFSKYLGITSTSSYAINSTDYFTLEQFIEGFNCWDLSWGTADAKSVTLSFWVRSSLTGTFGGALYAGTGTLCCPFSYTISSANTWTKIAVTLPGPTTGTWTIDNSKFMGVVFGLGVGSTYSSTPGSWQASVLRSCTGATSVVGTNGATWYITGVQLEIGSTATSFDIRPYGTELALCQRYYEVVGKAANGSIIINGMATQVGSEADTNIFFKVSKRAIPTVTVVGTWSYSNTSQTTVPAIAGFDTDSGYIAVLSSVSSGRFYMYNQGGGAYLIATAEL